MGGVGAALTGASALIGAFKKDKSPQSYAAAAPTQTADQAEMSSFIKPYMKDWMTNPPKVSAPAYTPTRINYGGGGARSRQTQQAGGGGKGGNLFQSLGGMFSQGGSGQAGGGMARTMELRPGDKYYQDTSNQPTAAQRGTWGSNQSGFSYTPGQTVANPNNAAINTQLADLGGQMSALQKQAGAYDVNSLQSQKSALQNQANMISRQLMGSPTLGGRYTGANPYLQRQVNQGLSGINSQISGIDAQIAEANKFNSQIGSLEEQQKQLQGQLGPENIYEAGEMNIDAAPTGMFTEGMSGGFMQGRGWDRQLAQIGQSLARNPYGAFQARDYSDLNNAATQGLSDQSRRISAIEAPINQPAAQSYQNGLESTVQNRLTSNMDRKLQEGYDASYLQDLAAQGVDPINDAYKEAIRTAGADFNRLGLGGSGFELGGKYGSQNNSITSKYLDSIADVQRDVALKGAEAARADRFANASLQDQATSQAGSLSQQQNANQFSRLGADVSRDMQQRDLTNQALQLTQNQELQNRNLLQQRYANQQSQDAQNESNRQFWTQSDRNLEQMDRDNLKTQVGLGSQLDQQDESNRQWWANKDASDRQYDNSLERQGWQDNLGVMQWLSGRDDEAQKYNIAQQLGIDTQNIGYEQQALANIMSFISGQSPQAQMANSNYWQGINQANASNLQSQSNLANAIGGLGTLFGSKTTNAPVQSTVAVPDYQLQLKNGNYSSRYNY